MARSSQDWEELGRNVQNIVDRAVNSQDYQKLNQTIRQVVDRAVDIGSEAVRKAARSTAEKPVYREQKPPVVEQRDLSVLYGSTSGKTTGGFLKLVGGALLCGVAFLSLIASLVLVFAKGSMMTLLLTLGLFGGGGWLIGSGIRGLNTVSRFNTYRKLLGNKTHCSLEKLARGVGKNEKFVRRELQGMIAEGLFTEGHLDKEETMLITSHETFHYFEQSRLQLEQRQQQEAAAEAAKAAKAAVDHDPQVQEVLDRGNAFIREIRRCNDAIPGVEISEKISRMEQIVGRIFERAEAHPEIVPDLKKMMDYYLPMTVKLLNAYADMDAQPVQGETITGAKREIEETLDTLNLAFEKLLDSVFADTALDVSSDISVLNTLLAQEGLTEDELTKMKKQRNL